MNWNRILIKGKKSFQIIDFFRIKINEKKNQTARHPPTIIDPQTPL